MRHIGGNEKRFALANDIIHNAVAFTDPHLDVALELVEILFGIDQMNMTKKSRPSYR
jgi:hypothetical protein